MQASSSELEKFKKYTA